MSPDESKTIDSIDDRYNEIVPVAERGLANAYAATDTATGERVFLKILRESKLNEAQSVEMFRREVEVLRALSNESSQVPLPKLLSEGIWLERPYFTQPFLKGWSLDQPKRKHVRFKANTVLKIIDGCLSFLTKLHDAGYAHGDISPDNIFMKTEAEFSQDTDPSGFSVVLLDYNSARRLDEPPKKTGERNVVFLKLPYAAPSIAFGNPLSVKSDLYSLGVVFYELIVGARPFHDPKSMKELRELRYEIIPYFPIELRVPQTIKNIVNELLNREPQGGFSSAVECRNALVDAIEVARWWETSETSPPRRYHLPTSKYNFVSGSFSHSTTVPVWSDAAPITVAKTIFTPGDVFERHFDTLIVKEKSGENRQWELRGPGIFNIGRAAGCEIRLDDTSISRHAAAIVVDDNHKAVIKIISHINAPLIRVNGEGFSNEVGAERQLHNHDSVEILNHLFEISLDILGGSSQVSYSIRHEPSHTGEFNSNTPKSFDSSGPHSVEGSINLSETPEAAVSVGPAVPQTTPEVISAAISMACEVPVSADNEEVKTGVDIVDFSVFAPATVVPEASFILEIWAYLRSDRDEVLERASRRGRLIEKGSRGAVYLQGRSEITLVLRLDNFELTDTQDTIIWSGDVANVSFIVKTPRGLRPGTYPGQVNILHNGLLLTRLIFELTVDAHQDEQRDVNAYRHEIKSAFASYASPDRDEVLRRVQGIRATGMDVFVDVLALRSGQSWEEELYSHIRTRDIFYLFWSSAARDSEWVAREWHYALKEKGIDFIHPIPLAPPDQVPPPEELRSKHFNDIILAVLKSHQMASIVN